MEILNKRSFLLAQQSDQTSCLINEFVRKELMKKTNINDSFGPKIYLQIWSVESVLLF